MQSDFSSDTDSIRNTPLEHILSQSRDLLGDVSRPNSQSRDLLGDVNRSHSHNLGTYLETSADPTHNLGTYLEMSAEPTLTSCCCRKTSCSTV